MTVFDMGRDILGKLNEHGPEAIVPLPMLIMDEREPKTFAGRYDAAETDEERAALVADRLDPPPVTMVLGDWAKVVAATFGTLGVTIEEAAQALTGITDKLKR